MCLCLSLQSGNLGLTLYVYNPSAQPMLELVTYSIWSEWSMRELIAPAVVMLKGAAVAERRSPAVACQSDCTFSSVSCVVRIAHIRRVAGRLNRIVNTNERVRKFENTYDCSEIPTIDKNENPPVRTPFSPKLVRHPNPRRHSWAASSFHRSHNTETKQQADNTTTTLTRKPAKVPHHVDSSSEQPRPSQEEPTPITLPPWIRRLLFPPPFGRSLWLGRRLAPHTFRSSSAYEPSTPPAPSRFGRKQQ